LTQVYLAQDLASGRLFALKKIRCPLGQDSVREALNEVEGKAWPLVLAVSRRLPTRASTDNL